MPIASVTEVIEVTGYQPPRRVLRKAKIAPTAAISSWHSQVMSSDMHPTRRTRIFRPEDGGWKIVHRHADPITTPQPAESVIQE